MSTFVGNMLDVIGQARGNEGAINVLRKSYVSSEMDKAGAGMTAEERQAIAFNMRHSVNTSYKYLRDLAKDRAISVQRLRREVQPSSCGFVYSCVFQGHRLVRKSDCRTARLEVTRTVVGSSVRSRQGPTSV